MLKKAGIRAKLRLILGSILVALIATISATLYTAEQQRGDAKVINIAGRQRMLSQKMTKEAYSINLDPTGADHALRNQFAETTDLFEKSLRDLIEGNPELGIEPTVNPVILAQMQKVDNIWREIRRRAIAIISENRVEDYEFERALLYLIDNNGKLLAEMDTAVRMYERAAAAKVRALVYVLLGFTIFSAAVIVAGILIYRRSIAGPLYRIRDAINLVGIGDLTAEPLPVDSRDEIGQLSSSINYMVDGLRERDRIKDVFGRFQSVEVVNSILGKPDELMLTGERREITIMFTDLRGFTALSDSIDSEKVVHMLNKYFEHMVCLAEKHGGTVNEILGDGLVAFFGAPLRTDNHATAAVRCAIEMQNEMQEIHREYPELRMGIGIGAGEVVLGNIGCADRAKYAAVGNVVNLTARITNCAEAGQIFCTSSIPELVGPALKTSEQLSITLKGYAEPIPVFNIIGLEAEDPRRLEFPKTSENNQRCRINRLEKNI